VEAEVAGRFESEAWRRVLKSRAQGEHVPVGAEGRGIDGEEHGLLSFAGQDQEPLPIPCRL
jgi:hypothetical protein